MPANAEIAALTERIVRLERELTEYRDRRAIEEVLLRYARACDWLDDALLASVFFDDAEIDYGFFRGSGREFCELLMQVERSADKRWHVATQLTIQLDGDRAYVESYQFSVSTQPGAPRPQKDLMHAYGFYADHMEKRGGRWGIARRKHLLVAGIVAPDIPADGLFAVLNHVGRTSPTHPDYRRATGTEPLPGS